TRSNGRSEGADGALRSRFTWLIRVIAVDWSGSASAADQRRRIWMATAEGGDLTSLGSGRTRREVIDALGTMRSSDPHFAVGFDFSFSFPAWFGLARDCRSAPELWDVVALEGESWLRNCSTPFWGRRGTKRVVVGDLYRRTEVECGRVGGIGPKSIFQLHGPGSVGTGSIRGMPMLRDLRSTGFSLWPFDPPGWPCVVEMYPRAFTGPVVKSNREARRTSLAGLALPRELRNLAEAGEDAFDAAVSAVVMSRHSRELRRLKRTNDRVVALEGAIWLPRDCRPP
ncbi:MAG: hypothetical protein ACRDV4_11915, partial [Acidimicrobiales bacterium]